GERRIERRVDVPLDGRKIGQPPRLDLAEGALERVEQVRVLRKEMNRRSERRRRIRQTREGRHPLEREVQLERRPGAIEPIELFSERFGKSIAPDELAQRERITAREHGAGAEL